MLRSCHVIDKEKTGTLSLLAEVGFNHILTVGIAAFSLKG